MTAEQGMQGEGGGEKLPLQTSFAYHPYPPPLATYEDVVVSRDLFMDTLKKLHVSMGTKFMVPIVGGRDLDLHRLFVEVTYRGGIAKVLSDKKWKEVTAVFSFPSSATNASFILRKYYVSLLYHYEQIYFFKAKCWTPSPTDAMLNLSAITVSPCRLPEYAPTVTQLTHAASAQQKANAETSMPEVSLAPSTSAGSPVCGVIDGKFDCGYLITVKIGMEEFRGVLYQVPNNEVQNFPYHHSGLLQKQTRPLKPGGLPRRKRRKKSEIRKRDPAHPKPNRSGYNFFFAEQHAKLKPHYHGKDREISRIIGESWNKLQQPERAVYQEKARKDKERYKMEMEAYRERLRTGQITSDPVVMQQQAPVNSTDLLFEGATASAYTEENEMSSDKSRKSNLEGYESAEKESDFEECCQADHMDLNNVDIEVDHDAFDLQTRKDHEAGEVEKISGHGTTDENRMLSSSNNDVVVVEGGMPVPIEGIEQASSNANESVPRI